MVGVKWYVIWITCLLRIFIPYVLLSLLISIVMVLQFPARSSGVTKAYLMHTDFFTIFSVLIVYSWQLCSLCLLLGQIFSRSNQKNPILKRLIFLNFNQISLLTLKAFLAKTFVIIFWFASALDFYYNWSAGAKYLVTFMPNTSLKYVQHVINQFERSGKYLQKLLS